jgi:hypothetical protein
LNSKPGISIWSSYLTLVDIADFRKAIGEMARVLKAGGSLLIANRFASACAAQGWVEDEEGQRLHFPVDAISTNFRSGSSRGNTY